MTNLEAFRIVLEQLSEGVALFNEQREMVFGNRAYQLLSGYEREEIGNCFDPAFVHADDRRSFTDFITAVFTHPGCSETIEYRLRHQQDRWIWVETYAENMLEVPGSQAVFFRSREITDRKHTEKHLNRMRNILLESQKIAHFGSFEYIAETQETVWSDEEFRIYGLDPADGSPPYEEMLEKHIHPDDAQALQEAFFTAFTNSAIYELEHKIIRPDGTVRIVRDVAHPYFDDDGNLYKYIGTTHDITEQKETEEMLQRAQRLQSIGQLAGGVAHDFNNMLSAILGHVEIAKIHSSPSDAVLSHLEVIQEAGMKSAELVRQLLAFARKQTITPVVMDINEMSTIMLKMLARLIGEGVQISWLPGENLWKVKADKSQIDQVLVNLCLNARDAIVGTGKIIIETRNASFDEAYRRTNTEFIPGHYVMLAVSDDGCGMGKDVQQQVFDPFFTTKEVGKGTGLGLATVYGIVKQNGGFINIYSEPGQGTTFRIYLPQCEEEKSHQPVQIPVSPPKGQGERVLLVEDEPMTRNVALLMLKELGYQAILAETPGEAINIVKNTNHRIDLLITDVIMPEMNGRKLANVLHEIRPELSCLFTSGYTADVISHHGVLDEGVCFLPKPFSMNDLAIKIHQALTYGCGVDAS
jgi:PAS domain S-box-containing protein